VELEPDNADRHHNKGVALGQLGRFEEALQAYERAVELEPDNADRHHSKGVALERLGRFEAALEACERAVELAPHDSELHNARGVVLVRLRRYSEALTVYDRALRLTPGVARIWAHRGEVLLLSGHLAAAEADLREAIWLRDADALEARVLLAVLRRNQDPDEAAILCLAALREHGRHWSAFRRAELRALAYLILRDAGQAAAELRAAVPYRRPDDIFQTELYEVLDDPPLPGLEDLIAVWSDIRRERDRHD
jgi:Flp pilus assembly protein TadD